MSYYYTYYLGYQKDGKIYPLGPYDCDGKLGHIFSHSRSFASDLHEEFYPIPVEQVSEELDKEFSYTDYKDEKTFDVKMLPFEKLPSSDFIKRGYCRSAVVQDYLRNYDDDMWSATEDVKYEMVDDAEFAVKALQELKQGPPKPEKDEFGEIIPVYSCSEYMYFCFPDWYSVAYETWMIRQAAEMFEYSKRIEYDMKRIVVLLTEG